MWDVNYEIKYDIYRKSRLLMQTINHYSGHYFDYFEY